MATPAPERSNEHTGDRRSPRTRRAQLKRRVRWLLAGSSIVVAVGIYVGLAAPVPFSGANEMATSARAETTISTTVDSTAASEGAPTAPTVTPTQATPVSRSSGS